MGQQQQFIEQSINKRDEQLMVDMREMQETKKLLAPTEEKKKPFFERLFKK